MYIDNARNSKRMNNEVRRTWRIEKVIVSVINKNEENYIRRNEKMAPEVQICARHCTELFETLWKWLLSDQNGNNDVLMI